MAAFKRCPCIGWRQIDRLHIAGLQAVLFQQPDQQVMHIAALVQRDFFALEFGNGLDDRVPGHQDGLGLRRCRVVADIGKLGSGGLRKDGRCLANEADIHCAQVQAFEQLGASRKLDPFHRRIERCQTLFQRALGFLQHEQTGRLLVADAQLCLLLCLRGGQTRRRRWQSTPSRFGIGGPNAPARRCHRAAVRGRAPCLPPPNAA